MYRLKLVAQTYSMGNDETDFVNNHRSTVAKQRDWWLHGGMDYHAEA